MDYNYTFYVRFNDITFTSGVGYDMITHILTLGDKTIDCKALFKTDFKMICDDVEERKELDRERYKGYDPSDIKVTSVVIDGKYITMSYCIKAQEYDREPYLRCAVGCVGKISNISDRLIAYPPLYVGKVCW